MSSVSPSIVSSQDKYVAVAVHEGLLKVFYNVEGNLSVSPDPQDPRLKISNAKLKFVSESLYLFQLFLKKMSRLYLLSFIHLNVFCVLFSVGCYLSSFEK